MPTAPPTSDPVHIVGGGLAGLAAAVGFAQHGIPVTVLEARQRLGGRASSFVDPESGETLDNCQHVSMGCCTNLRRFCETVGVADQFRPAEQLTFIDLEGRSTVLRSSPLPAPLHLAPAFARLRYLTLGDKFRLAMALRQLARWRPEATSADSSLRHWLETRRQSERLVQCFWEPVLVSALSESLDRIDIGHARKVLVDGFLRHRDGWRVYIPQTSLDQLFGPPVERWLAEHGGAIRYNAAVRRLHGGLNGVTRIELRSGESIPANDVVLAVPHGRVLDLLPPDVAAHPMLAGVARIESAPITSLHLWFDRPITDLPHAVLLGRLSQWIFSRGTAAPDWSLGIGQLSLVNDPNRSLASIPNPLFPYQVVISASRSLKGRTQESVRDQVLDELRSIWPTAREARLVHWRMVTEHNAVFSVTPGIEDLRPSQQSPTPNLQLAGDWTATGWPATMEGAVRSGYLAAENILRRRGFEGRLLQPDLPTAWLFRLGLSE